MLFAGLVSVWPSYALKLIVDILATGQLMQSAISVDLIPKQLLNYGFDPIHLIIKPRELVNWIPLILLGVFAMDGALRFVHFLNTYYFGALVASELREQAHERLTRLDLARIRSRNSGDFVSCLTNDLNLIQSLLADSITALINDSACALALGIWLLIINWKLSLIGLVILPVFFFLVSKVSKKIRQRSSQGQESTAEIASFVSETVQGADLLHLFNVQALQQNKFKKINNNYLELSKKFIKAFASLSPIMSMFSAIGIGSILWIGLRSIFDGSVSVGDFSSYVIATILLYQPVKRLFKVGAQINQIIGTCKRVFELIDQETQIQDNPPGRTGKLSSDLNIEFANVDFYYSESQPVLQKVNLKIEEGDQIAIVGSSGSGKSTLIALIPRLYDVIGGELKVKGANVKIWNFAELRSLVSYVPQDPFLFSGSLRENLLMVRANATTKELEKALELAKVDFLNLIDGGLDGQVGERGFNLSGGQRQRISIARAFLKDSPLLILDEPTSSLDHQSEELIKQSIGDLMKNRTVILVTHKLNTIKEFGRIICMNEGKIIEEGNHNTLMKSESRYKQLILANQ